MEIKATLFNIDECGYYKRRVKEPIFGDINRIIENLYDWSEGEELSGTKLVETDIEKGIFPIYLLDLKETLNGWAIACWNAVPTSDGKVGAIKLNTRVGDDPDISWTSFDEDSIPGFPSYYWINTQENIITAITPKAWSNSIKSLEKYIKDFMRIFSEYTVRNENNDIVGYSETNEVTDSLFPKFKISLLKRNDDVDFLIQNYEAITKISKKGMLKQLDVVDAGAQTGIVRWFSNDPRKEVVARDAQVNVILEYRPSQEEVIRMIEEEDRNLNGSKWDDIGFYIPDQHRFIWVNGTNASDKFEVNAILNQKGILSIDTIDMIIRDNGHQFLALRSRTNNEHAL